MLPAHGEVKMRSIVNISGCLDAASQSIQASKKHPSIENSIQACEKNMTRFWTFWGSVF